MNIILCTHNRHKIAEFARLFDGTGIKIINDGSTDWKYFPDDIPETGGSFEANAMIKARAAATFSGLPSIADDSGLCVDFLGGFPGVDSAIYAGEGAGDEANNQKLIAEMSHAADGLRGAHYVCVIAFAEPGGREFTVRGECAGEILREYRGNAGFGYDPLFYFPPLGKTFAELSMDEKNFHSHRAAAAKLFAAEIL